MNRAGLASDRPASGLFWLPRGVSHAMPALAAAGLSSGLFFDGYDSLFGQGLQCVLASVVLGLLLLVRMPSTPFWRAVALPLGVFGLALLWIAIVGVVRARWPDLAAGVPLAPDLFLPKFLSILAGLWALLIGARIGWSQRRRKAAVYGLTIFLALHLLLGLLLRSIPHGGVWDSWSVVRTGRFAGLVGNPNVTAAMAGVTALLGFAGGLSLWRARSRGKIGRHDGAMAMLYGAALLLGLASLMLTASRLPAALTFGLMGGLLWLHWRKRARGLRMLTTGPLTAGAAMLLVLVGVLYSDMLVERLGNVGQEWLMRWKLWQYLADVASYHPWLGYGPGAFSSVNAYYLFDSVDAPAPWTINSAHNIALQLLLVGGVPYLVLMAGGSYIAVRDMLEAWNWRDWDTIQGALVMAVLLVLGCAMIDIVLDITASTGVTLYIAGLAWGSALSRSNSLLRGLKQAPAKENRPVGG